MSTYKNCAEVANMIYILFVCGTYVYMHVPGPVEVRGRCQVFLAFALHLFFVLFCIDLI